MQFDASCACTILRRATRTLTATYDAALVPTGLRLTQFSVLRTLARLGPVAVTSLAAEVALDRSTMGRNLDPLERRGLVSITVGESDGRERIACITVSGEAAIAAALPAWRAVQDQVAGLVPPGAIDALARRIATLPDA